MSIIMLNGQRVGVKVLGSSNVDLTQVYEQINEVDSKIDETNGLITELDESLSDAIYAIENDEDDVTLEDVIKDNIRLVNSGEYVQLWFGEELISQVEAVQTGEMIYSTSIEILQDTITLNLETLETKIVQASISPSDCTQRLLWSSSSPRIATINSDGVITPVSEGTTTITAVCGAYSDTVDVIVKTPTIRGWTIRAGWAVNQSSNWATYQQASRGYIKTENDSTLIEASPNKTYKFILDSSAFETMSSSNNIKDVMINIVEYNGTTRLNTSGWNRLTDINSTYEFTTKSTTNCFTANIALSSAPSGDADVTVSSYVNWLQTNLEIREV